MLTETEGIPHYLTQDDEYNGYHIPKGSVIHPLEWYVVAILTSLSLQAPTVSTSSDTARSHSHRVSPA